MQDQVEDQRTYIQLDNFLKAIEMFINDVKLDPYILTKQLLTIYFSGNEQVSLPEIAKFFKRFKSYFLANDAALF